MAEKMERPGCPAAGMGQEVPEGLAGVILDDSELMIQAADLDTLTMLYANRTARAYAGKGDAPCAGQKCYQYMMGLEEQCPFCPLRNMNGAETAMGEVDNGKEIFAVKTKLVNWQGKQAFIEYAWDMTEVRRAEQVFKAQTDLLLRSIPDAQGIFHLDLTADKCLNLGGCSASMEGFPRDAGAAETLEKMIAFVPEGEERRAAEAAFSRAALIEAYSRGEVQTERETRSYFEDGTVRPIRLLARLLANPVNGHLECIVYGVDISAEQQERQQYQTDIREQLAILDALGKDYIAIGLVRRDTGRVKLVKLAAFLKKKVEGRTGDYEDVCQRHILNLVRPTEREKLAKDIALDRVEAELAQREEYSFTYEMDLRGQRHECQLKYLRLGVDGQILMAVRFIDELVAAEKEQKRALEKAMAAAEQAYIAAEHANQAKTSFLNSMSHDIRTPMNAILGFTALASTHVDQPEIITDYLGKIMASSNHLLSLINDVLDMSRIESGKMKIEERECNLSVVIHDLRNMLQADIRDKRLDLFIDTVDVVDENVICDRLRLNQVLINVLSNAIKFTNPGGAVSLRVMERENSPEDFADFDFVVRDNGIGMSEEFAKHIFEPFSREENSTVSGIPGTGLGMSITKNLVDMMNGTISVKSQLGQGSEFTISLRFLKGKQPAKKGKIKSLEGLRALVADDSTDACVSTAKMLKVIGMRADWTTSGKEAVVRAKYASEENDEYKVYIIDWLIPDMNGVEVVRRIRRVVGSDAPIIILTAYDWSDIEQEAKEAGVTAFCAKPLFLSELYSVLQDASEGTQAPELPAALDPEEFAGRRILLVDDIALNREIAEAILQEAGIQTRSAENGEEALRILQEAEPGEFDLVLMDVMMPVMDGYEATRRIRAMADPKKANIPVVAMTANAFEEDRAAALKAGMNEHLAKPFHIEELHDLMRRFIH